MKNIIEKHYSKTKLKLENKITQIRNVLNAINQTKLYRVFKIFKAK